MADPFNPWPYVEGTQEVPVGMAEVDWLRVLWAQQLNEERASITASGFAVLRALVQCAANSVPAPGWLADAAAGRFDAVRFGSAESLEDKSAFGPSFPPGTRIGAHKLRAKWEAAFRMLDPRRREILRVQLGLTPKQVRALLPTRRRPSKKAAAGALVAEAGSAANPFGLRKSTALSQPRKGKSTSR